MTRRPVVVHVDDEPDDLKAWKVLADADGRFELRLRHPRDLVEQDLRAATVVLVDIKLENWNERDEVEGLSLKPRNGLALLAILLEHSLQLAPTNPCAFALFTGAIAEIARGLVPREHIIARAHNLEWVFEKGTDYSQRVVGVGALASAVAALPQPWPGSDAKSATDALINWLRIPPNGWRDSALSQVARCHPPIHEYAEATRGVGVVRWFLHRILPYPCFLLDVAHVAARLRVSVRSLKSALDDVPQLRQRFDDARYSGALADLMGPRWWRAGIDAALFALAPSDPGNIDAIHEELRKLAPNLELVTGEAVPVLTPDYLVADALVSVTDVVEIAPDDWPPYADPAWATKSDVSANAELRAIVVPMDG